MTDVLTIEPEPEPPKKPRRTGLLLVALLAIFLLGFIPQWIKGRNQAASLKKAEHALTVTKIVKDLGSSAIDARRGEYEAARVEASTFFTAARFEIDQHDASALTQQQRDSLAPLLAPRDELITLLARSDPASGDKLSNLYVAVRKVLGI
jgi:hypothetical protein